MAGKLVILDRDGVINRESASFIKSPDEWQPLEGSIEAIALLSGAGLTVAVATNQSGIARKLLDTPTLDAIHQKFLHLVRQSGGYVDRIVYCPHHPDEQCDCRKPSPGLFQRLAHHYEMPLDGVPMIGDSLRDIEAAKAVGGRPILVLTGNGEKTVKALAAGGESVETYADLKAAAQQIVTEFRKRADSRLDN